MGTVAGVVAALDERIKRRMAEEAVGIESLLRSFLDAHPELGPGDCVLMEQRVDPLTTHWWVERKTASDEESTEG